VEKRKSGDSSVQRQAEEEIRNKLGEKLKYRLAVTSPDVLGKLKVDGYCENPLTCVEIWAHHGPAKSAQKAKI